MFKRKKKIPEPKFKIGDTVQETIKRYWSMYNSHYGKGTVIKIEHISGAVREPYYNYKVRHVILQDYSEEQLKTIVEVEAEKEANKIIRTLIDEEKPCC